MYQSSWDLLAPAERVSYEAWSGILSFLRRPEWLAVAATDFPQELVLLDYLNLDSLDGKRKRPAAAVEEPSQSDSDSDGLRCPLDASTSTDDDTPSKERA